jgi:hypothetical protein
VQSLGLDCFCIEKKGRSEATGDSRSACRCSTNRHQEVHMKRILMPVLLLVASLSITSAVYAQGTYYVQSVKAKVMSAPSFKAGVIGEVGKGFKFVSSGRKGAWVRVKYRNKTGYVPSLLLASHPPFERMGLIRANERDINRGVRRRASSYTSAAAARGLASEDRRRLSKEEKADYGAVDRMESFKVTPEELRRFMEGK